MEYIYHYDSPLGGITIASDGAALTGLWFDGQKYFGASLKETDAAQLPEGRGADDGRMLPVFEQAVRWLDEYFKGKDPGFTPLLNIEPNENKAATPFRSKVWKALLRVPYGETVTYKELAEMAADADDVKLSARAVGGAVGHNPITLIIPCHRVIGADGSLTGYAGGIDKKTALLKIEGAAVPESGDKKPKK